ncbi:MAG: DUF721 domain-containing protein [Cryobacterium sp.]|nr:DUF721 domain-containing protein [Oligoflexia bacterium]
MAINSIKDILDKIRAKNPSLQKRLEEALAVDAWEKTVGTQIANHARALKVEDGVLWIEVDHSVWRTELHHRKRQILEKLNAAVYPDEQGHEGLPKKTGQKTTIKDLFLIEPKRDYAANGKSRSATYLKNTKN